MSKNTTYVSLVDNFLSDYLNKHPEVKNKQKDLRATWWDKDSGVYQDELSLLNSDSKVKLEEYAYFSYDQETNKS